MEGQIQFAWAIRRLLRFAVRLRPSLLVEQLATRHPKIREREQRFELSCVLRQAAIPNLHITKLPLDHAKRMLDLRPDTGLELFDLLKHRVEPVILVQRRTLARPHRDMPLDCRPFAALVRASITCIGEYTSVPSPCSSAFAPVTSWTFAAVHSDRVYQARVRVQRRYGPSSRSTNWLPFLRLMHLGVSRHHWHSWSNWAPRSAWRQPPYPL